MKIKYGMVGGGPGSFIGGVHRKAAALDSNFELVCGAFSSDPQKSKVTGEELGLDSSRVYGSYDEMIEKEKALPENERMDAVSIVTPNHVHFDPSVKAMENGFHVILDKPMAFSLEEAKKMKTVVESSGMIMALTHTYTGYPMVKQARDMVQNGKFGAIRKVYVEYPQGWLSEEVDNKQASWRVDPKKSGAGGAIGDIGTHAANLAEYVTGSPITDICADLNTVVKGRLLDDDSAALLKFKNGSSGILMATQVAAGIENDLKIRVYGEKGGFEWNQVEPNSLIVTMTGEPVQIYRTGQPYTSQAAQNVTRTPPGHPEGYLEAFANIYNNFAAAVRDHKSGSLKDIASYDYPTVDDGIRGMAFIETMIASNMSTDKWTKLEV